jgi:hypothetical protein
MLPSPRRPTYRCVYPGNRKTINFLTPVLASESLQQFTKITMEGLNFPGWASNPVPAHSDQTMLLGGVDSRYPTREVLVERVRMMMG